MLQTVWILVVRDVLRFWRQRGRMLSSLMAPIVILIVFGDGYGALLRAGDEYRKFLLGGMVLQSMIFSANISASSLIWDREFGFLKVVAMAPVPLRHLALGKIVGAAVQAVMHGVVFLFAAPLIGIWMGPLEFMAALGVTFVLALGLAGLAMTVASRTRTYEDFNAVMLFFSIPMLFMSGAHFPVMELPDWLKYVAMANPVTYGVDALKHLFIAEDAMGRWTPDFSLGLDLGVLAAFTAITVSLSVALFRLREG
jgi:ABC-2 type transport system permease protein